MHKVSMAVLMVFGVLLAASSSGARHMGQNAPIDQIPQVGTHPPVLNNDDMHTPIPDRMEAAAARSRNTDRHKHLVDDTNKLLQLSTELKSEVDKSTKDEMSVQVIQKAAAIEKLAHDVKERMKG